MEKDHIICLLMATHLEAKPFIGGLSLTRLEQKPFSVYRNKNHILIISGIGKANAAMACAYSCLKFAPSCIVNLGAAGATGERVALGEPLHVKMAFDYDRPQFKSKSPHKLIPEILEGFSYAKIATLDRPVTDPAERKKLSTTADLIDMESASIIQACRKFKTPCYVFKYVSDTPKHTMDNDIVENIRKYRNVFFSFLQESVLPKL
ncbi:MAG: adenosylhomocysteine nucleosidase [Thermodesulfobacteriota bacterium]|nr:adenosylhomocysteine nucleosidase [Thermodesulfobacteriota bacterium]